MAYEKDKDYQALINQAAAAGDYAAAARYEQQRNEKIADLNATGTNIYGATPSNQYSQYLGQPAQTTGQYVPYVPDWYTPRNDASLYGSTQGYLQAHQQQQVKQQAAIQANPMLGQGLSSQQWADIWGQMTAEQRAVQSPGSGATIPLGLSGADEDLLSQEGYAVVQYAKSMWNQSTTPEEKAYWHQIAEQVRQGHGYSGGDDGSWYLTGLGTGSRNNRVVTGYGGDSIWNYGGQPTWESPYKTTVDNLLDQILTRENFSYNVEEDPLYQQYREQYNREGDRAMNDTLAAAASQAGGMNSYAIGAAQQANDFYASQLMDRIPELHQLAYQMYLDDIDMQVRDLGLVTGLDDTQYNRYRDTMSDWYNDRDFAYGVYRDSIADSQWDQSFQYNAYRDSVADSQWQQSFGNNTAQIAYDQAMDRLSAGIMPNSALLQQAGISISEAQAYLALMAQNTGSGSKGSYSVGSKVNSSPKMSLTTAKQAADAGIFEDAVLDTLRENGYSDAMLKTIYGYDPTAGFSPIETIDELSGSEAQNIARVISDGYSPALVADMIERNLESGAITEAEADYLLRMIGK